MSEAARSAESRKIFNELLEAEDLGDEVWLARAQEARRATGLPLFSELMRMLTHLRFRESEAEATWPRILEHRRQLSSRIGRDVGLRLAVFDWFVNIDARLKNPKVLEIAQVERTEKSALTDWQAGL